MNKLHSNDISTKKVITIIGFIVFVVVVFYFANFHNGLSKTNADWGAFGDYVGGILNPVIAAFAFYLIAKTYELQKRELKLSTDALNDLRTDEEINSLFARNKDTGGNIC